MALERGLPRSALRCEEDRGCQLCARFSSSELSAVTSGCDWELQNPVKAVAALWPRWAPSLLCTSSQGPFSRWVNQRDVLRARPPGSPAAFLCHYLMLDNQTPAKFALKQLFYLRMILWDSSRKAELLVWPWSSGCSTGLHDLRCSLPAGCPPGRSQSI